MTTEKTSPHEINPDGYSFKEYITSRMRASYGADGARTVTSSELADTLGMSTKVFLEILNGRRVGPDRRDFVIALCAELGLDAEETGEALRLYPAFIRPLTEEDPRDAAIMQFLNSGFDTDICFQSLNQLLETQHFPALKIRYRNQSDWRSKKNMKKINWGMRHEEERLRYNYYTSLGYDEKTASVLALYTYGDKKIPNFSISDAYDALADGLEYPVPPPPEPVVDEDFLFMYELSQSDDSLDSQSVPQTGLPQASPFEDLEDDAELPDLISSDVRYSVDLEDDGIAFELPSYDKRRNFRSPKVRYSKSPASLSRKEPRSIKPRTVNQSILDTDEYESIEEKQFRSTHLNFTSTFRMTTNTASAGILLNQLRNRRRITRDMVRIEEMLNYFCYRQEIPKDEMFRVSTELKNLENGKSLLYINVQGKEEVRPHQNIVIVLDVSGSMGGNAEQTQAAIATIVSRLNSGDRFSLVTYSNQDEVVIDGLSVSGRDDRTRILEKLLGLEIDGWTNGSAGIEKAYEIGKRNYLPDGSNQVILITDGDLNFGITSKGGLENLIEQKKRDHLFLSVIGTGLKNFKDDKLEALCKHGNGVYRVVNNLNDVKKSIRDEYASLVNVIAKDVKAQVEFNPEIVASYRLLGFENRELNHEDFVDDRVISEPFGSGGYGVALYELVIRDTPEQPESDLRYSRVVTSGSDELGIVKIRYKEPLADNSHEIQHVIPSSEEHFSDNLRLAYIVYVCAEKLRNSNMIEARDEALALADLERLGTEIQVLNIDDLHKLREILSRSKDRLNAQGYREEDMIF